MSILKLLSQRRISRALFKVCRTNGFESLTEIETYYLEKGSFDGLLACSDTEKEELLLLVEAERKELVSRLELPPEVAESGSLLRAVEVLLTKDHLLPKHQLPVFKKSFWVYQNSLPMIPSEIGKKMALPEAYIRRLRKLALAGITKIVREMVALEKNLPLHYDLPLEANLLCIDKSMAQQINSKAGTSFAPQFLGLILGSYLEEQLRIIGQTEEVMAGNFIGTRHYWRRFYLVKAELAGVMDISAFVNEVHRLLKSSTPENPKDFKTFVSYFIKKEHSDKLEAVVPIAKEILLGELGQRVEGGMLVLTHKKEVELQRYPQQALEALNCPSRAGAIRKKVTELHPEVYFEPRGFELVLRAEWGFTHYRRVYGLKKWNLHRPGTAFIEAPSAIEDIDRRLPFKSEAYWKELWHQRLGELQEFTKTHSRLPKMKGPGTENTLYLWLRDQQKWVEQGKLDKRQLGLLEDFRAKYPSRSPAYWKAYWDEKFAELKAFTEDHSRLPAYNKSKEEEILYDWFMDQRLKIRQGKLDLGQQRLITRLGDSYGVKSQSFWKDYWNQRFGQLKSFVERHSRLPARSGSLEEEKVGKWLRKELGKLKRGRLDSHQQLRLENLLENYPTRSVVVLSANWNERFGRLKTFTENHGRLPSKGAVGEEEKSLGIWLINQSKRLKNGRLDANQEMRLKELKERYRTQTTPKVAWEDRLRQVAAFAELHNRLPNMSESMEERSLRHWMDAQQKRWKKKRLSPEQQELYEGLRALYSYKPKTSRVDKFDANFAALTAFTEEHGRIPQRTGDTEEKRLYRFMEYQRQLMKLGKLDKEHQKLILGLKNRYVAKSKIRFRSHWDERFEELKAFAEANGWFPKKKGDTEEERTLNRWFRTQSGRLTAGRLDPGQEVRLQQLKNRYWYGSRPDWDDRFRELNAFAAAHSRRPGRNGSEAEKKLLNWWQQQGRLLKRGDLSLEQQEMLLEFRNRYPVVRQAM